MWLDLCHDFPNCKGAKRVNEPLRKLIFDNVTFFFSSHFCNNRLSLNFDLSLNFIALMV